MLKRFNFIRRTLFFSVVIVSFSSSVFAVPLSEYRDNISHLRGDLDSMIEPDEDSNDADNLEFEQTVLEEFPELLPARDKVEWQNSSVEINNQWIYDALQRYKSESPKSPKRKAILTEINERLSAIEQKLNELETPSASTRAKDEDKQKLAEILRREEYQKPEEKQESLFQKIMKKIDQWLSENFPSAAPSPQTVGGLESFSVVLQWLLYALVIGAIGFLLYRFAPFLFDRFKNRETREREERVILGERLAADETAENLFGEAERMARAGDLRGAIRKGYIALLCELSDKKIIGLSRHKTNRDYLRDVRKKDELFKNMSGLTNNYERHWYGFEEAKELDWEEFKSVYRKAVNG